MVELAEFKLGRLNASTFEQALELRNRGFEGYYSNMQTTMEGLLHNFGVNGIRPELSVVAYVEGRPVGFVFIAVKIVNGVKLAWNGGTGVFPEYRGKGIAKAMMQEAQRIIQAEGVDRAILEVVTVNSHAIAAYQSGGFQIVDRIIGLRRTGPLDRPFGQGASEDLQLRWGKPGDVRLLPFYRDNVAWACLWHNVSEGESVIVRDSSGNAIAYALVKRDYDENDQLKSIVLFQCEADPAYSDRSSLFKILLDEVYGPIDLPYDRHTENLSMSSPELINILAESGFKTLYEQYVMILDKISR